jgi:hypothetical protein
MPNTFAQKEYRYGGYNLIANAKGLIKYEPFCNGHFYYDLIFISPVSLFRLLA